MTADLSALIARLEAAEVGSRELDEAVWMACGLEKKIGGPVDAAGNGVWEGPHVSYFLDAALALAERLYPEGRLMVERTHEGRGWAMLQPGEYAKIRAMTDGETPALALVIAILRAKQGEGE